MKKKIFDKNLFQDAFRQLLPGALISGVVLCLQAILIPIGTAVSGPAGPYRSVADLWQVNPLSVLMFCCFTPLMALYLFRFLSKRNACDFYHSIPQTRSCLYISFTAALLVWSLILQWGSTFLGMGMHKLFPAYFELDVPAILTWSLKISSGILFVLGAVLLAVTLTGNWLTNLVVSLLIIFFPRVLMLVIKNSVGDTLTVVSGRYLSFMGNNWNVVTGLVLSVFTDSTGTYMQGQNSGWYTALVGILYLAAGCVMFVRRKSEAAGEASVNPRLQTVFRSIPAATFCLIPCTIIFHILIGMQEAEGNTIYQLVILYLVGIFLYFMYELVSTRKLKNLWKAVPGLGFLALFNVLVIFGMFGVRRQLLSFSPEASQIESVRLIDSGLSVWYTNEPGMRRVDTGYLSSRVSAIELTDENLKQLVADRLKESIAYDDKNSAYQRDDWYYTIREVGIKTRGRTHYRSLHLTQNDLQTMAGILKDTPEIRDIYMNLPDAEDPDLELGYVSGNIPNTESAKEDLKEIYNALKEDAAAMGFEKWYLYCNEESSSNYRLYMGYREGSVYTSSQFEISEDTPRAMDACMRILWKYETDDREEMMTILRQLDQAGSTPDSGLMITYCGGYIGVNGKEDSGYSLDLEQPEQLKALISLLEQVEKDPSGQEKGSLSLYLSLEYVINDAPGSDEKQTSLENYKSYYYDLTLPYVEGIDLTAFDIASGKG